MKSKTKGRHAKISLRGWIEIDPSGITGIELVNRCSLLYGDFFDKTLVENGCIKITSIDFLSSRIGKHGSHCLCGKKGLWSWLKKVFTFNEVIIEPMASEITDANILRAVKYYIGFIEYFNNKPIAMVYPKPRNLSDGPYMMRAKNCHLKLFVISNHKLALRIVPTSSCHGVRLMQTHSMDLY